MVQGITNLLRVVEAHHNHQMVGVEELTHCSQKGVEGHLSDQWVEEELLHLVVTEVLMGMVMVMDDGPPPPRRNRGNGRDGGDDGDGGGGDDSPPLSDQGQPQHHQNCRNRWVYVVQGPPRPPGPRINVLGMASAPLDTTGLENSFENLGRTMVDVLTIQQQTNVALQDQIRRANDTQMEQTLAMHDPVDMTEQRTYDSMFAAVPIYHGNDSEDFDEWADQLEALCEISR